jgi:hypothetical protein
MYNSRQLMERTPKPDLTLPGLRQREPRQPEPAPSAAPAPRRADPEPVRAAAPEAEPAKRKPGRPRKVIT